MIVVNKHTLELTHREVELAYKKCRMVILGVIRREKNPEWKQKYIEAMGGLTKAENEYINS